MKDKIVRIITVTPIVTMVFLIELWFLKKEIYPSITYLLLAMFFLSIMTLIAYPLQKILPGWKDKGRDGQRTFALYLGMSGYLIGFIVNLVIPSTEGLDVLYGQYILSCIILFIFNKVFKVKASGHIGGLTCILVLLLYYGLYISAVIVTILIIPVIISSIRMKRHTPKEMASGALSAVLSMVVVLLIMHYTGR